MTALNSSDGLVDCPDVIDSMVSKFYRKLFEKGDSKINNLDKVSEFLHNMEKLEQDKVAQIDKTITLNDLHNTLKTCTDSAPGPDGIPYSIIKLTWKYFGTFLLESWLYSLETGSLTHSHESSYLKLLPKDGKDLTLLKNWRPITLSNCDLKLITKTLASKLTVGLECLISHNQTAYIKGRQITDNLHLLQYAVEKSSELDIPSMIVSLDAEKAFDSVEHWYIKEVLKKLGLEKFITIFELLYSNQNVSIHLGNRVAGNYKIKNGVKQGDALSCILFILGIEPLLKNINLDCNIAGLKIHGNLMPKTIAYADDVACIIHPSNENIQKIFTHYQRMSDISGLNLNADKSEIITNKAISNLYQVIYNNITSTLIPCDDMKVNGLQIGFNIDRVRVKNFKKFLLSIERQLMGWSNRNLSILGKIQIYKTFGLSQILFIAATTLFTKSEETQLNNLIYKFIWTKDLTGNKAPDRIKRSILNSNISLLGFGMLDYREIITSIRIKSLFRLLRESTHPFNEILLNNINRSVINIDCIRSIRPTIDDTILKIRNIWKSAIKSCPSDKINGILKLIQNEYIGYIIQPRYKNKRLALLHKHDRLQDILTNNRQHPILKKLDVNIQNLIMKATIDSDQILHEPHCLFPLNYMLKDTLKLTSKQIRTGLNPPSLAQPKLIESPDNDLITHLGLCLKKMTNPKLKGILLRALHGDIYSGTRLKKFGMTDSDLCPRCNLPETIQHQLFECEYVRSIWNTTRLITSINCLSINDVLGHNPMHDKTTLTIHAEVIRILLAIERPLTDKIILVKSIINRLSILEKGTSKIQIIKMKEVLESLT